MKVTKATAAILLICLIAAAHPPENQHQQEMEAVRDEIIESLGYPPVFVNDSTRIVRVERHWSDQIRVHLENGHTLRVTVELESY